MYSLYFLLAEIFLRRIPTKYIFKEVLMPAPNLKNMDVDALLALRSQIDGQLATRRGDLQKQLARLQKIASDAPVVVPNGRTSAMKGVKVKPKYRDARTGDTWAGRGVQPRWLTAALKAGKKLDDFLIDKSARKTASKTRRKRK
jgi:DNA-binding protein H-NS